MGKAWHREVSGFVLTSSLREEGASIVDTGNLIDFRRVWVFQNQ
jgi:hypothetical protein